MPKYAKILSYEEFVKTTDISNHDLQFYLDGMNEENGEISGIFKRARRGDYGESTKSFMENEGINYAVWQDAHLRSDLVKEIGDRHWYTLRLLQELNITWDTIVITNWTKLKKRKDTDTILGHGDNREDKV